MEGGDLNNLMFFSRATPTLTNFLNDSDSKQQSENSY